MDVGRGDELGVDLAAFGCVKGKSNCSRFIEWWVVKIANGM